jgi:hypothetical protein
MAGDPLDQVTTRTIEAGLRAACVRWHAGYFAPTIATTFCS